MRKKKYKGIFCTQCESIVMSDDEKFFCYCDYLMKPTTKEEAVKQVSHNKDVWEKWRQVQITISSVRPGNRKTLRNVNEVLQAQVS